MYATKLLLELVMIIMEFADYKPRRTLEVPHDPLHPTNRKALDQYLEHCWQSILWCDMMMRGLRLGPWWDFEVENQVSLLWCRWQCPFGTKEPKRSYLRRWFYSMVIRMTF